MKTMQYLITSVACLVIVLTGCPKKENAGPPISDEAREYNFSNMMDQINSDYLSANDTNYVIELIEKDEKLLDKLVSHLLSDNPKHIFYLVKMVAETGNQSIKIRLRPLLLKVSPSQILFKDVQNTYIIEALALFPQENGINDTEVKNIVIGVKKVFRTRPISSAIDKTDSVVIKKILQTMLDNEVDEIRINTSGPDTLSNPAPRGDFMAYHSSDFTKIKKSVIWAIKNKLTSLLKEDGKLLENMIKTDEPVTATTGAYINIEVEYSCSTRLPGYERNSFEYSRGLGITGSMTVRFGEETLFSAESVSIETPDEFSYEYTDFGGGWDMNSLAERVLWEAAKQFTEALFKEINSPK